jgi:hypothetical protein
VGAVAQNPAASEALLDRIARLPDPRLHEAVGSLWNVMGANRQGLAVMRLLCQNPNTGGATLSYLAAQSRSTDMLREVLRHPKTPLPAIEGLARHADENLARDARQELARRSAR